MAKQAKQDEQKVATLEETVEQVRKTRTNERRTNVRRTNHERTNARRRN